MDKINYIENRKCLNCGKEFTVACRKERKSNKRRCFCTECMNTLTDWQKKAIRKANDEEYNDRYKEQKRNFLIRHYKEHMLSHAKIRAKKYGLDFDLTVEDLNIPQICPILEVPLVIGTNRDYEYSPSLDRIDNSKGYIKGNVQIISKKANSMKNSASISELKAFCKNVLRYSLNTTEQECSETEDKEPQC